MEFRDLVEAFFPGRVGPLIPSLTPMQFRVRQRWVHNDFPPFVRAEVENTEQACVTVVYRLLPHGQQVELTTEETCFLTTPLWKREYETEHVDLNIFTRLTRGWLTFQMGARFCFKSTPGQFGRSPIFDPNLLSYIGSFLGFPHTPAKHLCELRTEVPRIVRVRSICERFDKEENNKPPPVLVMNEVEYPGFPPRVCLLCDKSVWKGKLLDAYTFLCERCCTKSIDVENSG